jgi:hypothetical protein
MIRIRIGAEVRPVISIASTRPFRRTPLSNARTKASKVPIPAASVGVNAPSQIPPRTAAMTTVSPMTLILTSRSLGCGRPGSGGEGARGTPAAPVEAGIRVPSPTSSGRSTAAARM